MNQQTQFMTNSQSQAIRQTCPKCGYIRETAEKNCLECGKPLQKVSTIRTLGVILVVMGSALLGFMSWLSFWAYGTIANPSKNGSHFNGDAKDLLFMMFVFGLVISIGIAATAGGIWQVIFGKRNKLIVIVVFVLGFIFAATGFAVILSK